MTSSPASPPADLPVWQVRRLPEIAGEAAAALPLAALPWSALAPLPPLELSDGSAPATQQTAVRLAWDDAALYVRFDCADRDAWGTYTRRDEPLYREETVEIFLAPGEAVPAGYFELEVSPLGTLFDAWIDNPDGRRDTLRTETAWDCPGVRWAAGPAPSPAGADGGQDWWAALALPWSALAPAGPPPAVWRANFFRIERPRDGSAPELSAWSPTLAVPPDFHRPARFGFLRLTDRAP